MRTDGDAVPCAGGAAQALALALLAAAELARLSHGTCAVGPQLYSCMRERAPAQSPQPPLAAFCARRPAMPSVDPQRKLAALANLDLSVEQIRHITGPNGLFTLAPGRMAASTVRDLKRRQEQFGNVLHRKRRVDPGTRSAQTSCSCCTAHSPAQMPERRRQRPSCRSG